MLFGKTIVVTGIASGIGARVGELAIALGADVIGIDVKAPASPLAAFVKADIASPQAIADVARTAAATLRRPVQCRRRLGRRGRGEDAGDQFLWLARAERGAGAAPARRRRDRQRRLDRRLWLARQSRARQGVRGRARLSRHRRARSRTIKFPDAEGYPLSKELLLLWTMQRGASAAVQGPRRSRQCGQPGTGDDADPQRIPPDFRRCARRRRHRARRPRRRARPTSRRPCCSSAPTARAGSTAPTFPVDGGLEASINASVLGF